MSEPQVFDPGDRVDPPLHGDEVATLRAFLAYHRDTLRWKCSGLTQEQLATPLPPSEMTLGGMMKHLAIVRSVSTQDNSHSAGVDRVQRGDPKNRSVTYPFFGSAVAKLVGAGESGLPPYIWVKPMSGGFVYRADAAGHELLARGPMFDLQILASGQPEEERRELIDRRAPAGPDVEAAS